MARKRMSGEERREQIISSAVELFAAHGFAGVTTRSIATGAGISEAMIYKHFSGKEELYDAVIMCYANVIAERIKKIFAVQEGDYREKMVNTARAFIDFISNDQKIMRVMLYSGLQDHPFAEKYFRAIGFKVFSIIQDAITKAQQEGKVRNDVDAQYCTLLFFGTVVYYNLAKKLILKRVFTDVDDERFIEHLDKVFFNGIKLPSDGDK